MGFHGGFHVAPGGKDPLAPDPFHFVHHAVENPHAQVGHAKLVCVGKAKGNPHVHLLQGLDHLVVFPAGVAGWLLDGGQDAL